MWHEVFWLSGWGLLGVMALMFLLWLIHFPLKNAALVDIGWAYSLGGLAVFFACEAGGWFYRKWALAVMVALWAGRLGTHLAVRILSEKEEEGRYQTLRRQWSRFTGLKFLAFYQMQALLNGVLAIPFVIAAVNAESGFGLMEGIAMVLWLCAFCGEALADYQLRRFKADPANKGKVCDVGLWSRSRHPNYFFEWLIWVAYALFAAASPYGWLGFISPALILYFLFKVTGIPATEEQSLKSKGDAYRRYQEKTPAFFPRLRSSAT